MHAYGEGTDHKEQDQGSVSHMVRAEDWQQSQARGSVLINSELFSTTAGPGCQHFMYASDCKNNSQKGLHA